MTLLTLVVALAGCGEAPPAEPAQEESRARGEVARVAQGEERRFEDRDQGQKHPPLPADNPIWDWDAGGFVPDFGWYGEHSWADVRMRVAGHMATAARDKARVQASSGDLEEGAATLDALVTSLGTLDVASSEIAVRIHAILVRSAERDAALLRALAGGQPPAVEGDGIAAARARYLGLALRHEAGETTSDLQGDLEALRAELSRLGQQREDLDLRGFDDFTSRHELRVRLFEAAFDAADPLGLEERWGYWTARELARQLAVLHQSVEALRSGPPAELEGIPATQWPSRLAETERSQDQLPDFTVEGLGWLPTGDSLIDVGSEPGPMAIGTLEKLGLDDEDHKALLAEEAEALNAALVSDPASVQPRIEALTARFDAMGHGSRYYNIKQARNEAVRQLALAGEPALALAILRLNRPLHHQDWACPNREGILLALEGRLLAEAGQARSALDTLDASLAAAQAFLADVDAAEKAGPHQGPGRTPPQMGGGGPPPPGGGGPGTAGPPEHRRGGQGRMPPKERGREGPPGPPPGRPNPR